MADSLKDLKILIVEDDQFLRDIFVMKLKKEGVIVSEAEDGEEALKKIKEIIPDIVLLDIVLPKMDGFDVLGAAKKDGKISKIPIVLLTNLGQQDNIDKGLKLGAASYIVKDHFTPSEVMLKIKELVAGK